MQRSIIPVRIGITSIKVYSRVSLNNKTFNVRLSTCKISIDHPGIILSVKYNLTPIIRIQTPPFCLILILI